MKQSLRENTVKQSLNAFAWARYCHALKHDEAPLIIKHHNGVDSDNLTLDSFDLNLSLLKELRTALQEDCTPAEFDELFDFEGNFPRKVTKRTEIYKQIKFASDEDLATMAPIFGGCLFKPKNQESIVELLNEKRPVKSNNRFLGFLEVFWLSAWQHSRETPLLTSMIFGLDQKTVDVLKTCNVTSILQMLRSDFHFRFSIELNEALFLEAHRFPRDPVIKLLQISNKLQTKIEMKTLYPVGEDDA